MKLRILFALLLLFTVSLGAQNLGNLDFVNSLGDREAATYGDAVTFFMLMENRAPGGFEANVAALDRLKITTGIRAAENTLLDRGMLALMVSRYLKIVDSLLYLISGSGRYAFRACAEQGIMDSDASEWDVISGEGLIEVMAKVSAMKEAEK
ncbi:MAG TPA: hypothetical protein PK573_14245 [Spirochaetota bacterium]|nr:hypothetical protein [Spirochaetota bacterium]